MRLLLFHLVIGTYVLLAEVQFCFAANATECYVAGLYNSIPIGKTFRHPNNNCAVCLCCKNGKYTCRLRRCPKPRCGVNKQTQQTGDGCCKLCASECEEARNYCETPTNCDKGRFAFEDDSCCPTCGCIINLGNKEVTVPEGPFGHPCENCTCYPDGSVTCNRPACPTELLECVNPTFNSSCGYICQNNTGTCRRGSVIIEVGQFVSKRNKVCTCNPSRFYPRAFCANLPELLGERYWTLYMHMCVAYPELPPIELNPLLQE